MAPSPLHFPLGDDHTSIWLEGEACTLHALPADPFMLQGAQPAVRPTEMILSVCLQCQGGRNIQ